VRVSFSLNLVVDVLLVVCGLFMMYLFNLSVCLVCDRRCAGVMVLSTPCLSLWVIASPSASPWLSSSACVSTACLNQCATQVRRRSRREMHVACGTATRRARGLSKCFVALLRMCRVVHVFAAKRTADHSPPHMIDLISREYIRTHNIT